MEDLKVGDRVEIMNKLSRHMGRFGVVKKVNKHVRCNTTYYSVLLDAEQEVVNFDKCELRLAAKKAVLTTFKIGDKVFINEKCTAYKDLVGKHGIVTDVAIDSCKVEFGANDYIWITDEVVSLDNAGVIKIGDKVIVRGNVPHYGGCKGKVLDVYGSIRTYVVEVLKNGNYCSQTFLVDELMLDNGELKRADENKIGVKVKVISKGSMFDGAEGTITRCSALSEPILYEVTFDRKRQDQDAMWFYGKTLALIAKPAIDVGMHVVVSSSTSLDYSMRGVVRHHDAYAEKSWVYFPSIDKSLWFLDDDLSVRIDNDISEKLKSKKQMHHKAFELNALNVGDKVIINTKNYGDKYYSRHGTIMTDVNLLGNYEVKLEEFEEYVWIPGAYLIKLCHDIWHVSAEFMQEDCSGEAFGED